MKTYKTLPLAYFDKLKLPKNSNYSTILKSLKNFYSNEQYVSIHLNFKTKPFYIAKNLCDHFANEYEQLKDATNPDMKINYNNFIGNEIYNTLHVEHYTSSRRAIKSLINDINYGYNNHNYRLEINLLQAYRFVSSNPTFNQANIRTLYGILIADIDMGNNQLDGTHYRQDTVSIGKYCGLDSNMIDAHMDELIKFFNNNDDHDYVIKALLCTHILN